MSKVITRSEAKSKGLSEYYTGKPCSKGHISSRYTSNKMCISCSRNRAAEYYKLNGPDKFVERRRSKMQELGITVMASRVELEKVTREKANSRYQLWTDKDDAIALAMINSGRSIKDIAIKLGRTYGATANRLTALRKSRN